MHVSTNDNTMPQMVHIFNPKSTGGIQITFITWETNLFFSTITRFTIVSIISILSLSLPLSPSLSLALLFLHRFRPTYYTYPSPSPLLFFPFRKTFTKDIHKRHSPETTYSRLYNEYNGINKSATMLSGEYNTPPRKHNFKLYNSEVKVQPTTLKP